MSDAEHAECSQFDRLQVRNTLSRQYSISVERTLGPTQDRHKVGLFVWWTPVSATPTGDRPLRSWFPRGTAGLLRSQMARRTGRPTNRHHHRSKETHRNPPVPSKVDAIRTTHAHVSGATRILSHHN